MKFLSRILLSVTNLAELALLPLSMIVSSQRHAEKIVWGPPRPVRNLGDRAMVEMAKSVFSDYAVGTIGPMSDFPVASLEDRTRLGNVFERRRAFRRILGASSLVVVGADIVDGHWGEANAVKKIRSARIVARNGAEAAIVGFSWNANPSKRALREMRKAVRDGVKLFPRDSLSHQRLKSHGISNFLSTDLAFHFARELRKVSLPLSESRGGKTVVMNLSWSAGRHEEQLQAHETIWRELNSHGYKVIWVPTDLEPQVSDLNLINKLPSDILKNSDILTTTDLHKVLGVLASADFVVTGRMHLAILSWVVGTPAIGLEYQGKFEGMFTDMGTPQLLAKQPSDLMEKVSLTLSQSFRELVSEGIDTLLKRDLTTQNWKFVNFSE